jgi:hypothetical protein
VSEFDWTRLDAPGSEHVEVSVAAQGVAATGHIVGDGWVLDYTLLCDADWRVRSLWLSCGDRIRTLVSDGEGSWSCGEYLPGLQGAVDVDISATPLTNTLPIRRLGLAVGDSAEIVTAYVDVPSLDVTLDPQRYTRLSEQVYRYESLDSDFTRDVEVDPDGFVLTYPGLFARA